MNEDVAETHVAANNGIKNNFSGFVFVFRS